MDLKAGAGLRSAVCSTEVIIVRPPSEPIDLRCGGEAMAELSAPAGAGSPAPPFDSGTLLGKRYVHEDTGLEVLCTKAGAGALSAGDQLLPVKDAKPLPSSD